MSTLPGLCQYPKVTRLLPLLLPVVAVAAVTVLAVTTDARIEGEPAPDCVTFAVFLKTDDEMRKATDELKADPEVSEAVGYTKAQNYENFKRIFANRPDLLANARVEAIPASIRINEAVGVDADAFAERLRAKYGKETQHADLCERAARPTPTT